MTPPRSFVGTLTSHSWLARFHTRALIFGLLTLLFVALALFPQRYRAAVTLTPTDPQSLGLSGALGQLGAINNVFGNQAAVEVALRVGKGVYVRDLVIHRLALGKRLDMSNRLELHRWLDKRVTIRSLRGGIVSIEMQNRDPKLARDVVAAYGDAMQEQLAEISRKQTSYKRKVLEQLVNEASDQLEKAQAVYDRFRLRNRTPLPALAVEAVSSRIPMLESAIKAKLISIAAARELYSDNNSIIRQMNAELAMLRQQLAQVRATNGNDASVGNNATVGEAVATSSQLFRLEREVMVARTLYDSYLRFLQGTAVEDLTSSANVRILEPPFIDTERQVWWPALAAALAMIMLWLSIEFYRLRPPLGARLEAEDRYVG
ncbi:hypothetical protein WG901_10385 [Novosphingobium sp. PS1R-30]|uniref:Lipopolysaccharide biosynthesis protein n=1 Tax=Novosphingobium anseongense TaxID=3133436 RepID=A0ABU8RVE6_9SPHN